MATADFYRGNRSAEEYEFSDAPLDNHSYLAPAVSAMLDRVSSSRVVDLGCGNGTLTASLARPGRAVTGVENSPSGLGHARTAFPDIEFVDHDLNDPLPEELTGRFDVAVAAEVIEHLFLPRRLFSRADEALTPGGALVLTTPFHGYWKNLALALTNSFDEHWRPGWDYGHIKFFSKPSLAAMAQECGYEPVAWDFLGRTPRLAKSMVLLARRR